MKQHFVKVSSDVFQLLKLIKIEIELKSVRILSFWLKKVLQTFVKVLVYHF